MNKKLYITFLYLLLIIYGCSSIEQNPLPSNTVQKEEDKLNNINIMEKESIIFGLTDESSINSQQTIHKVDINDAYTPKIYIKNQLSKGNTYRLFFFKNYIQTKVEINNELHGYYDLYLNSNEEQSLNFKIPSIEEGLNDILVIAVREPDNYLEEPQYIDSSQVYISRRVALLYGDSNRIPKRDYFPIDTINVSEQEIYTDPFVSFYPEENFLTLFSKQSPSQILLNMGANQKNKKFVFISILGTEQVFLNEYNFIQTNNLGNFTLPLKLSDSFSTSLPQNLILMVIENPFTLDESILLSEDVKFNNLITVGP